jgi:hypothetical protein
MGYGTQPKKREYKLTVTVMVDDASKYEEEMERFCTVLLAEIRAAHRNITGASPNEQVTVERI